MGYVTHEDMELQHVTSSIRIARNKNQRDLLPWHVALAPQTMTPRVKKNCELRIQSLMKTNKSCHKYYCCCTMHYLNISKVQAYSVTYFNGITREIITKKNVFIVKSPERFTFLTTTAFASIFNSNGNNFLSRSKITISS
jgi:hypothetical protein